MLSSFNTPPKNVSGTLEAFTLHVPEEDLSKFQELLKLSEIGPATWWNTQQDSQFGVSREWLSQAKNTWLNKFTWRDHEHSINKFPNFKIAISDEEAGQVDIHFAALFSKRKDAIPVIFLHGFPASFMEFLPMMQLLADRYTPETLPYHIIVPSLPDYGLSGSPTTDVEMTLTQAARIMNQLMLDLGFVDGYAAQGGDLGSMLARIMSVQYEECKAFHVNMLVLDPGESAPSRDSLTPKELDILQRTETWRQTGLAYALVHGTRPATVGLAMSSSPLALLAWIGEKLLEWVDQREPLPLDTILAWVSFYWFTKTFPRSLYHAELVKNLLRGDKHPISKEKPLGYSMFAHDLAILPQAWAKEIYPNLIFYRAHETGGHFASVEQPKAFLEDVEDFLAKIRGLL
ncbi:epoxide hydrolase [Penicillium lagena]|uniref:epoxide hydrolase n=1 Tax=Penicillium lagena TaxID=94218 RepID=UPI00253FBB4F|nr:epoxide hydrolase [Penicillium lagena]KAJ5624637.1 epoxide hydrolase [Penicillium lagena]